MLMPSRARYKAFTSFAMALCAGVAFVRLERALPLDVHSVGALAVCAMLCTAAAWRGVIYLRALRAAGSG